MVLQILLMDLVAIFFDFFESVVPFVVTAHFCSRHLVFLEPEVTIFGRHQHLSSVVLTSQQKTFRKSFAPSVFSPERSAIFVRPLRVFQIGKTLGTSVRHRPADAFLPEITHSRHRL